MATKKRSARKMWAGFVSGRPDLHYYADTPEYGRLYRTKQEGRSYYQDVRRVEIRECVSSEGRE